MGWKKSIFEHHQQKHSSEERLLTITLYQIKLGELVWKGYCILHSHHLHLHWWDRSQSEKWQLSCFYWDQDPTVRPLFWLSKHKSLWGWKNLIWVIRKRHCYWRCFSPPAAELNAMFPAFASSKNTSSFRCPTDCQGRHTMQSHFGRQIWMKVPYTPFTHSCSWTHPRGRPTGEFSQVLKGTKSGELISQSLNPFSLLPDQQPRPWKYLQNKTGPAQTLKLIILTTKSQRWAHYNFPYTFPSTRPLMCFQLCE